MIRKTLSLSLFFLLMLMFDGVSKGEPLKFSLGVKSWLAEWHSVNQDGDYRSHVGLMNGPSAILWYQRFFVGATYLTGQFDFPITLTSDEIIASRIDTDVSVGYYFLRNLGLILGYKWIDFTFDFPNQTNVPDFTEKAQGPFGGLLGSYSLGQSGFNLYGNITYTWLDHHDEGGYEGNFLGVTGEIGLVYMIPSYSITLSEGIKYQSFRDQTVDSLDAFVGIVFNGSYTF